jgi:hypothetical protein
MIAFPKLILLVVLAVAAWCFVRWFNRAPSGIVRRRPASSAPPRQRAVEDLVACRTCGAYVVADGGGCGKPGCPQLR